MQFNLEKLANMSRALGAQVGYIQGGGGNTSVKAASGPMAIKASGLALASVEAATGFISVDGQALRRGIEGCKDEADYGALLQRCVMDRNEARRPSIETGFHALLGACVAHTHSVWVNLLTCSDEGRPIAAKLLPDAVWVPYATPGLALTQAVWDCIGRTQPEVLLLESHGVVISGPDPETVLALHEEVNRRVVESFGWNLPFPWPNGVDEGDVGDRLLFPDQAIYNCDPELSASQAGVETRQAVSFLLGALRALQLTPRFLDEAERKKLLDLESEKYRQKMVRS